MNYDGIERRADGSKIAVLEERIDTFIDGTEKERSRRREYEDKLLNKIVEMNERCIRREVEGCSAIKQHLMANGKEKDYKRRLWDNRIFQLGITALGFALGIVAKGLLVK